MYNKFMFEELTQLLIGTPKKQLTEAQIGKSVDLLRQLSHFSELNTKFGADYLVLILQTLQPFVLREGFWLIEECDHYLLVEGDLREEEARYEASRPVSLGKVLELNERLGVRFLAKSDCKMIRLKRGPAAGFHIEKKLAIMEKQRKKSLQQMQVILGGQNYKEKYEFLQKIAYFNSLGEYDYLDLVSKSHMQDYSQGNETHKQNQKVSQIGYILVGKVKLTNQEQMGRGRRVGFNISEGDWLGLEEFFCDQAFQSSGQANFITTLVVWFPRDIFERKFNLKNNYQLYCRMKGLIQAKKTILDRSLKRRRQKIMDIEHQTQGQKPLNVKLLEKILSFQLNHEKTRSHFRRSKMCKDIQVPQLLMHKVNFNQTPFDSSSLPKLNEKITLFPEEYLNLPVACSQRKELQRLDKIRNKSLQPTITPRNFVQKNPEKMYQTILEKLPKKIRPSPTQFFKTIRQQKPGIHYNMSIYNNFRVGKQRVLSPHRKFSTIDFLPKKE